MVVFLGLLFAWTVLFAVLSIGSINGQIRGSQKWWTLTAIVWLVASLGVVATGLTVLFKILFGNLGAF